MWRLTVREARMRLGRLLTGALENEARAELPETYAEARELAMEAMREFRENTAADAVPPTCPYSFAQILDHPWLPPSRAGVAEE
jgi:hypothetical protein